MKGGHYEIADAGTEGLAPMLSALEKSRVPIRYLAKLFSAGNEQIIEDVYRKLVAVRVYMRAHTVGDTSPEETEQALAQGNTTATEAEAIFRLTSLATFDERFVVPPMGRETAIESQFPGLDPLSRKASTGFGFRESPERRW
jgi:nitrate reductase beta subunit